ncbi:MAG: FAD-dependent oxidoreductase [Clostridia bacterium]|nr:FAD-dependent oxidoreductase [Clostridia bacterium]
MSSIWQAKTEKNSFPTLTGDISTDVAIVGGGLAGVLTAYMLKTHGVNCVVLEKNTVGSGTTAGSSAKITAQHGLIYHKLLKKFGKEKTALYYRLNSEAVEKYRRLAEKFPCELEVKDNFIYTSDGRNKIYAEMEALNEIGADAELFDSLPLPFDISGAVCFPNQAQFNPLKLVRALADGLTVYENTLVKDVRGNLVLTDKGTVKAERIIICSHFPFIDRHGLFFMKMYQHRSYMLALSGAPLFDGMFLDDKQDGISLRTSGELLLIGGGDRRTGKKGGCFEALRDVRKTYFPESNEKYAWAAQDCITLDSMPYIGRYSKSTPELYVATGFNKWGVTSSMVAAELLYALVTERHHPAEELFCPSRSMLHPQLILNAFDSAVGLLTPLPKRCTHLGCALKYNKAEHSWDCSCHGSRFGEKGEVLDGPANKKLS